MCIFCRKPEGFGFFQFLDTTAPVWSKYHIHGHIHCSLWRGELEKRNWHANKGIQVNLLTFWISLLKFKVQSLHNKAFFSNVKHEILIVEYDFVIFFSVFG